MIDLDQHWMREANCSGTDPEAFFPDTPGGSRRSVVLAVCKRCPVRRACLDYAIDHPELEGIWGGLSQRARYEIRTQIAKEKESVA